MAESGVLDALAGSAAGGGGGGHGGGGGRGAAPTKKESDANVQAISAQASELEEIKLKTMFRM